MDLDKYKKQNKYQHAKSVEELVISLTSVGMRKTKKSIQTFKKQRKNVNKMNYYQKN